MPKTIIELKTGVPYFTHRLQVAGYRLALESQDSGGGRIDDGDKHFYYKQKGGKIGILRSDCVPANIEIPSVSEILSFVRGFSYPDNYKAEIGTWIHKACGEIVKIARSPRQVAEYINGVTPESKMYGIKEMLIAFGVFAYQYSDFFSDYESEKVVVSKLFGGFGGTVDYVVSDEKERNFLLYLKADENFDLIEIKRNEMTGLKSDFSCIARTYKIKKGGLL